MKTVGRFAAWRCLLIVLATAAWPRPAAAAAGDTIVVFTVDVESNDAFTLPEQVDAVCAGAYTADERTLEALARNRVKLDSSLFWSHANSRLDRSDLARNLPGRRGGVIEIQVTSYERRDRPRFLFESSFAPVRVVRKLDP